MEKRYSSNRANNNSRQYARNERRRKKKMRRIVLICILFVLASVTLALLVYAGIALLRKPVSSTAANTTQPQSTENLASPPPFTPEPATQAASPTPTIDEDWYRERCDQLYHYLDMYGNFENPEDIAKSCPLGKLIRIARWSRLPLMTALLQRIRQWCWIFWSAIMSVQRFSYKDRISAETRSSCSVLLPLAVRSAIIR